MVGAYRVLFLAVRGAALRSARRAQSESPTSTRSGLPQVEANPRSSSTADAPSIALALDSEPASPPRDTPRTSQPDRVEYEWVPITLDAKFHHARRGRGL